MTDKKWGHDVWIFLHTLVSKINKDVFNDHKKTIIEFIFKICTNLPCPECSKHSSEFLKTVHFNNVTKKDDLIEILFVFHNQVNINTKKEEFPENLLHAYSEKNIMKVFNSFEK